MNNTVVVPVKDIKAIIKSVRETHTLTHRLISDEVPFSRVDKAFELLLGDLDKLLDERRQRIREAKSRAGKVGGASKSPKKVAATRQNALFALAQRRRNIKIRKAEKALKENECPDCGGALSSTHRCPTCATDWSDWPGWRSDG